VKRDFGALEKRRFATVKLFGKGFHNSEIGRRLKVSNQTVSRWRKQYQGGNVALRSAGRARRLPCLDEADKARLVDLLRQGPERLDYFAVQNWCLGPSASVRRRFRNSRPHPVFVSPRQ
jgi:transposase